MAANRLRLYIKDNKYANVDINGSDLSWVSQPVNADTYSLDSSECYIFWSGLSKNEHTDSFEIALAGRKITGIQWLSLNRTDVTADLQKFGIIPSFPNGHFKLNIQSLKLLSDFITKNDGSVYTDYNYINFSFDTGKQQYNITQNLTNCVSDFTYDKIDEGDNTLTLTCSEMCFFDDVPTLTIGETVTNFTLNDDKNIATLTINITGDCVVNATATQYYTYQETLTNCKSNFTGKTLLKEGTTTFTFTADSGYIFGENGSIYIQPVTTSIEGNGKSVLTKTYLIAGNTRVTLSAIKKVETLSTFNHLYLVDNDILSSLSKKRYYNSNGVESDYGRFITDLYIIPFNIEDILSEQANIILGFYDTQIPATQINGYTYNLNLGKIIVNENYGNVYDYINSKTILHVPFFNVIELPIENVMNQTLQLNVIVDLYDGSGTLNIVSSLGGLIHSETSNIFKHIPYIQRTTETSFLQTLNTINNDITNAYLSIINNVPYNVIDDFGKNVVEYMEIKSLTNYFKINDIKMNTSATNDEKNKIVELLKNGCFI
jgi:hypothetical protein